jgi:hypothetical protein
MSVSLLKTSLLNEIKSGLPKEYTDLLFKEAYS